MWRGLCLISLFKMTLWRTPLQTGNEAPVLDFAHIEFVHMRKKNSPLSEWLPHKEPVLHVRVILNTGFT